MQRSSPRARAGFRRFAASTAPSAAPAPTSVCSSSMNRSTRPSDSSISRSTAFKRSSNSPRNFEPATSAPRSSATRVRFLSGSGTSPSAMRRASPSAIAVFPTPGSPIRTGLFFVRRQRTCITRRISSSRPITGSSFPARASSVRSREYRRSAWYLFSGFSSVTRAVPRTSRRDWSTPSGVAPNRLRISDASPVPRTRASSRCSVDRNSSWNSRAARSASSRICERPREGETSTSPWTRGAVPSFSRAAAATARGWRPVSRGSAPRSLPSGGRAPRAGGAGRSRGVRA